MSKPMQQKILRDLLSRLTEEEVYQICSGMIQTLSKKGYLKDHTFILDTTALETTRLYENCGKKKVVERDGMLRRKSR